MKTGEQGKEYWAYGGDFGDTINSGNFCLDGIINADQSPQAAAWEVKKVFQPFQIEAKDLGAGTFTIHNRHHFITLDQYAVYWKLEEEGDVIQQGKFGVAGVSPSRKQDFDIDLKKAKVRPGASYYLTISLKLEEATLWADRGFEVGWEQFELPWRGKTKTIRESGGKISVEKTGAQLVFKGKNFSAGFDKESGLLNSYKIEGKEILVTPLKPNFWRPLTDNDELGSKVHVHQAVWKNVPGNMILTGFKVDDSDPRAITLRAKYDLPDIGSKYNLYYWLKGDGSIQVEASFSKGDQKLPELPRFGMQVQLVKGLDKWEWFGRGPHENYEDRNTGAAVGKYSVSVKDDFHHYVQPQESNNRTDVKWLNLTSIDGVGWHVKGAQPLGVSVWPYAMEDLEAATHTYELPVRDFVTLNIDYKQMGLGGDNTWSPKARPYEPYRIKAQDYHYSFSIVPITSKSMQ